jgi:hypothetical protein
VSEYINPKDRPEYIKRKLEKRVYIDGFTLNDLNGFEDQTIEIIKLRMNLCKFLSQEGEVKSSFGKPRGNNILIYVNFEKKETLDIWFNLGISHHLPELKDHICTIKYGEYMLTFMKDTDETKPFRN